MNREYGGCLPLEIKELNNGLYHGFKYVPLNSGRSAIAYAAMEGGFKECYIPYYTCKSVEAGLLAAGIKPLYYNIDEKFFPIEPRQGFDDTALFVYTNYFGIMAKGMQQSVLSSHSHVLFDNTQGFFEKPAKGAYSVYSCRKFFGVPDGAYLVADNLSTIDLPVGESADTSAFLLKALESGPDSAYGMSKENELRIDGEGMKLMSSLTNKLMSALDFSFVENRRRANFTRLHNLLKDINELEISDGDFAPMVYPLLVTKGGVREALVAEKIFVPRWWRWIEESDNCNDFEKHLSKHIVPLPISQNYDESDMEYIASAVLRIVSEK